MSAIDDSGRRLENATLPVDVTEWATATAASATEDDVTWWRRVGAVQLLSYGPATCVCVGTVGIALSVAVWIRLQRHLPATILYVLVAMVLELLPVYMHCGSYALKQVSNSSWVAQRV